MRKIFDTLFLRMPMWGLAAFCLLLVAFLGLADHSTGYEISFSIFYLVPIAITSWYGNFLYGFSLSLASAMVWLAVDMSAGHEYRHAMIPFWNAAVRFGFFIIVARFIAAQRRQLDREMAIARTDPLTDVHNTKGFTHEAGILWNLANRYGHTTSVAYIDLDNFKKVNDAYGHAEGDAVLKAVAQTLRKAFRSTDVFGRLGGDEFAALLPETSRTGAEEVFRKAHNALVRQARERGWPISVSIGVIVIGPPYPSLDEALKRADKLMYRAKQADKDHVLVEQWR